MRQTSTLSRPTLYAWYASLCRLGIKAMTLDGAYQFFEENSKGSIEAGKRADLVILDQNPMKVDPIAIKDIAILETIKDGETVFNQ